MMDLTVSGSWSGTHNLNDQWIITDPQSITDAIINDGYLVPLPDGPKPYEVVNGSLVLTANLGADDTVNVGLAQEALSPIQLPSSIEITGSVDPTDIFNLDYGSVQFDTPFALDNVSQTPTINVNWTNDANSTEVLSLEGPFPIISGEWESDGLHFHAGDQHPDTIININAPPANINVELFQSSLNANGLVTYTLVESTSPLMPTGTLVPMTIVSGSPTDSGYVPPTTTDPSSDPPVVATGTDPVSTPTSTPVVTPASDPTPDPTPIATPPAPTPTPTPAGPVPVAVTSNFAIADQTTGQTSISAGEVYSGPVAGLTNDIILVTPDNINVSSNLASVFIATGSGNDAIDLANSTGNSVMDGGTGSNFLTGGSGDDTFFVNDSNATSPIWSTVNGFHAGDAATIWGVTPADFNLAWSDNQGAIGYTGLTLTATATNKPTASLTLVGYSQADLNDGRLSVSFGNDPASGLSYMYVQGH